MPVCLCVNCDLQIVQRFHSFIQIRKDFLNTHFRPTPLKIVTTGNFEYFFGWQVLLLVYLLNSSTLHRLYWVKKNYIFYFIASYLDLRKGISGWILMKFCLRSANAICKCSLKYHTHVQVICKVSVNTPLVILQQDIRF